MTPERWQRVCDVFQRARQCEPTRRRSLLEDACGTDVDLRADVERLLVDDAAAIRGGFLDVPTLLLAPAAPVLERPGDRVGPYRLLEPLGEGGMGAVFLAEQDHPVRRRVALKLIKPGMDSAQVVARFAAERQALALMDHPNIARVLDAGATESGRPYFIMELVEGIPITDYCDRNRLALRQRLELFIPVCRAIQHAHQKGVIHRDIKPSNVLVALVDGRPVPKVIDFGVAKAIERRLTEPTVFTQLGAVVGTLEYMSPEQAGLSAPDVDTRSDVYSLGVLLYELLTGSTPLERQRLREAGYVEIARRILEEEPPRPSTRLSSAGDRLASIAERRGLEPSRLTRLVRGELDWIAMRCLEKDRSRRYETAGSLARDVERYLAGEAVEAGPPSAWYQLGKQARRHRAALAVAAAFAALLIAGAAFSTWLAIRATQAEARTALALAGAKEAEAKTEAALKESQEARSQAEAVSQFLVESLREHDPGRADEKVTAIAVLDQATAKLEGPLAASTRTKGALLDAMGTTYLGLGACDKAARAYERAVAVRRDAMGDDHPDTILSRQKLIFAYEGAGRWADAEPIHRTLVDHRRRAERPDSLALDNALAALGENLVHQGKFAEAEAPLRECLAIRITYAGGWPRFVTMSYLGESLLAQRRFAEAEPLLLDGYRGLSDRKERLTEAWTRRFLTEAEGRIVALYKAWGQPDRARAWEAKLRPRAHPASIARRLARAYAHEADGRWADAEPIRCAILDERRRTERPDSQDLDNALAALGENLVHQRRFAEAEPLLRECLAIRRTTYADGWPRFVTMSYLGECLLAQRCYAEAEPLLLDGYHGLSIREDRLADPWRMHFLTEAEGRIVALYKAWGRPNRARAWEIKLGLADLPADVFAPTAADGPRRP